MEGVSGHERNGYQDGDGWGRGRDGSRGLSGKLTGGSVGREVEDLGEYGSTVVFGGIMAVVHRTIEVQCENMRWLPRMNTDAQGETT